MPSPRDTGCHRALAHKLRNRAFGTRRRLADSRGNNRPEQVAAADYQGPEGGNIEDRRNGQEAAAAAALPARLQLVRYGDRSRRACHAGLCSRRQGGMRRCRLCKPRRVRVHTAQPCNQAAAERQLRGGCVCRRGCHSDAGRQAQQGGARRDRRGIGPRPDRADNRPAAQGGGLHGDRHRPSGITRGNGEAVRSRPCLRPAGEGKRPEGAQVHERSGRMRS